MSTKLVCYMTIAVILPSFFSVIANDLLDTYDGSKMLRLNDVRDLRYFARLSMVAVMMCCVFIARITYLEVNRAQLRAAVRDTNDCDQLAARLQEFEDAMATFWGRVRFVLGRV
eukprot:1503724-Rhodomonas_salina.2